MIQYMYVDVFIYHLFDLRYFREITRLNKKIVKRTLRNANLANFRKQIYLFLSTTYVEIKIKSNSSRT